jgi:hypothetical protein
MPESANYNHPRTEPAKKLMKKVTKQYKKTEHITPAYVLK